MKFDSRMDSVAAKASVKWRAYDENRGLMEIIYIYMCVCVLTYVYL